MQKVNIMVGRFQPITRGHEKCIDYVWKNLNIPTVICMVETKKEKLDEKHPFPSTLLLPLYEKLFHGDKRIKDIVLVKNANIVTIGEELWGMGYEIRSWVCGTDRYDSYKKMADKYAEKAHLPEEFEVIEIKRTDEDESATKLRTMLKEGNKSEFLKGSPSISLSTYMQLDYYEKLKQQIDSL